MNSSKVGEGMVKAVSQAVDSLDKLKEAMLAANEDMGGILPDLESRNEFSDMSSDFAYHCKYSEKDASVATEQVLLN